MGWRPGPRDGHQGYKQIDDGYRPAVCAALDESRRG
jgi:hypothetical protein